jgi:hypothetical protein
MMVMVNDADANQVCHCGCSCFAAAIKAAGVEVIIDSLL